MGKKRKRISGLGDAGSIAMNLLPIAGGFLLANVVEKQFLAGSSYANIVKLAGGVAIASMTKGTIAQLGVGMALNGAVDIAQPAMRQRMIKSDEEIAHITKMTRIADIGGAACVIMARRGASIVAVDRSTAGLKAVKIEGRDAKTLVVVDLDQMPSDGEGFGPADACIRKE